MALFSLVLASAASAMLVVGRILWTGSLAYGGLVWNLFLAWLPLVFALLAVDEYRANGPGHWRFCALSTAWFLFFPNAPYIFTDVYHLTGRFYEHFWIDLVMVLLCSMTGLVLGFVSLYLMHSVVARWRGGLAGWVFVAVTSAAGSFGIYLGRFLRFNSWDILLKPHAIYQTIGDLTSDPFARPTRFVFPILFALFLFISYLMLYALTSLRPAPLSLEPPSSTAR